MSNREMDDDYTGFVAQLSPRWRVVRCRDGIQWILQRRKGDRKGGEGHWEGDSYCRSRDGLIDVIGRRSKRVDASKEAMRVIEALPAWIELATHPDV